VPYVLPRLLVSIRGDRTSSIAAGRPETTFRPSIASPVDRRFGLRAGRVARARVSLGRQPRLPA
jgi:hypothetical protein